jgi:hypothetical protein
MPAKTCLNFHDPLCQRSTGRERNTVGQCNLLSKATSKRWPIGATKTVENRDAIKAREWIIFHHWINSSVTAKGSTMAVI